MKETRHDVYVTHIKFDLPGNNKRIKSYVLQTVICANKRLREKHKPKRLQKTRLS